MIVDEKGNTITDAPAMPQLTERQEQEAEDLSFGNAILRGIFAGWLIAMVVWI